MSFVWERLMNSDCFKGYIQRDVYLFPYNLVMLVPYVQNSAAQMYGQ